MSTFFRTAFKHSRLLSIASYTSFGLYCHWSLQPIYCDSFWSPNSVGERAEVYKALFWGKKTNLLLGPDESKDSPSIPWLENVALRQLVLNETYGACVDCRGDIYFWSDSFSKKEPLLALKGKNIKQIQLAHEKIFALSHSGRVYSIPLTSSFPVETEHSSWFSWGSASPPGVLELRPNTPLYWTEKLSAISSGKHHLLCLTNAGRSFAYPIDEHANDYGQLAVAQLAFSTDPPSVIELAPKFSAKSLKMATAFSRPSDPAIPSSGVTLRNPFQTNTTLFQIPALQDVLVDKLISGEKSSFALTKGGKVLGWGANDSGQIGLGPNITLQAITVPTQIVPHKYISAESRPRCVDINAGRDLTAFTMEYRDGAGPSSYDVLMCGNGQWGGLGNKAYTTYQASPVRSKNISGLKEYNDTSQRLTPIFPRSIMPSTTGHVAAVLDISSGLKGKDVYVWGKNHSGELGNLKPSVDAPEPLKFPNGDRVILRPRMLKEVRDMRGRIWKRNTLVDQGVSVGPDKTVLFLTVV